MKVLLTIWIVVLLIQEVVPSTLVRLPRNAVKKPSIVQTEYEAKYEQKGEKGNESVGKLSGKHEILHDNCADNWNSFADKCASLIKELVASLANAVSSKPGDATNLQLQIKNTFRHFDSTHNCSCLNHTGNGLSGLDLSPIFENITVSNLNPESGNEGEGSGSGQSGGQTCDGKSDCGKSGSGAKKQPNRGLNEGDNSHVNPENADGSKDGLTNNSRRQVHHPKFTTNSNSDPPDGGSIHLPSDAEQAVASLLPDLSEQLKSPLVGPLAQTSSSATATATATATSISSSPPVSDSQVLSPPDDSASTDNKDCESESSPQQEGEIISGDPTITPVTHQQQPVLVIPENVKQPKENILGLDVNPEPSPVYHHSEPSVVIPVVPEVPSESSGNGDQENSPSIVPSEPILGIPVIIKTPASGNDDLIDENPKSPSTISSISQPKVLIPVVVKETTGNSDDANEPSASHSPHRLPTFKGPIIEKGPSSGSGHHPVIDSGSPTGHHNQPISGLLIKVDPENNGNSHTSPLQPISDSLSVQQPISTNSGTDTSSNPTLPKATIVIPEIKNPEPEGDDCSDNEQQPQSSATSSKPTLPEATIVIPEIKNPEPEGDDCSDNEQQPQSSATSSKPTLPEATIVIPEIKNPEPENDDCSDNEQEPQSSATPSKPTLPKATIVIPEIKNPEPEGDECSDNEQQPQSSATPSKPTLPEATIVIPEIKNPEPEGDDCSDNEDSKTPSIIATPIQLKETGNGGSNSKNHESSSLNTPNPLFSKPVLVVPVTSKQPSHNNQGSGLIIEEQPLGNNKDQTYLSFTTPLPYQSKHSEMSKNPTENNKQPLLAIPIYQTSQPAAAIIPAESHHSSGSNGGDQSEATEDCDDENSKPTTVPPLKAYYVVPVPAESGSNSGSHHSSLTTPVPNTANSDQCNESCGDSDPSQSKASNKASDGNHDSPSSTSSASHPVLILPETIKKPHENDDSLSVTPVPHNPQPVYIVPVTSKPTENDHHGHSLETISSPEHSKPTLLVPVIEKHSEGNNDDSSSVIPVPSIHIPGNVDKGNQDSTTPTPVAVYYAKPVTVIPVVADSHNTMSDPYSGSQQERPVINDPKDGHSAPSSSGSSASESHQPPTPSIFLKPSPPGALIPHSDHDDDQHLGFIKPTTFQTTSAEPTTSDGHLPLVEIAKPHPVTTSHPIDTYKTVAIKPSTSPRTTETHEHDEDDEEDCCSCESCTEEEITDPKLYKENACKNLEEARKELKAIFDKIKKKLKCGRKAPQTITTTR